MTFLELEKKCKERRLKRKIVIFCILIFLISGAGIIYFFGFKNVNNKSLNNVKSVNKTSNSTYKPKLNKIEIKKQKFEHSSTKVTKNQQILLPDLSFEFPKTLKTLKQKLKQEKIKNKNEISKKKSSFLNSGVLPSYKECIRLAKKFYNKKDYENALKWAKNANIQNNKKEDSWIITALSLYKMGKKEEAVKVLRIYYNYNKSEKIKKILKEFNE